MQKYTDFEIAYDNLICKFGSFIPRGEIYKILAQSKAPRFYVSPEFAIREVSKIIKGYEIIRVRDQAKKMYYDIAYLTLKEMKRTKEPMLVAINKVLQKEAPSFYIKQRCMRTVIYNIKKKNRESLVNRSHHRATS